MIFGKLGLPRKSKVEKKFSGAILGFIDLSPKTETYIMVCHASRSRRLSLCFFKDSNDYKREIKPVKSGNL